MAASKRLTDQYNDKKSYVVKDLIWRDHISKIDIARKSHDKKWGFLHQLKPQRSSYDPKPSPRSLLVPTSSSSTIENQHIEDQSQQKVTVCPSPRPIPITTSSLIGWRTADKTCSLEKFGKYARGQESLHKKFKWPVEGFD